MKRYSSTGAALTGDIQVNTHTASSQWWPKIEMDDFGSFTIVWQSDSQDGSGRGVYARRYRFDGTPHTSEFLVNATTLGNQDRPAVASDAQGNLVVAWQGSNADGSGVDIYAQRLSRGTVPVFFSAIDAEPIEGSVVIRWEAASDLRIEGFNVYRRDGDRNERIAWMLPADVSEYVDHTAETEKEYVYTVGGVDASGHETQSRGVTASIKGFDTRLFQNHPNPFNPTTTIDFILSEPGTVDLRVYDPRGRLVKTLVSETRPAGRHTAAWDGRDASGAPASTGVYFYRLRAGSSTHTRKMLLLK
jgi:hypothetical protein